MNVGDSRIITLTELKIVSGDGNPEPGKEFAWGRGCFWRVENVDGANGVVVRIPRLTVHSATGLTQPTPSFTEANPDNERFDISQVFDSFGPASGTSQEPQGGYYPFTKPRTGPAVLVKQDPGKTFLQRHDLVSKPKRQKEEEIHPPAISNPQINEPGHDGRRISTWWAQWVK